MACPTKWGSNEPIQEQVGLAVPGQEVAHHHLSPLTYRRKCAVRPSTVWSEPSTTSSGGRWRP